MPVTDINITLGTAGHIDHGKTALVKMLTGCETDRLKEEKERGMSIDLGYAPCRLDEWQVGIVDVPGHEHFIKTMVAGASGIDAVILVVAADDGIMPQTREHLDILTLLGVRHGVVALTKMDRVPAERLEEVRNEVSQLLLGTFLAGAPILPVSNVSGEGFEALIKALASLVRSIVPRRSDGVFRVPLDRAFSARGFGTVVAGIPVAGRAAVGDEVVLLPQGQTGRIKRIQVYGRDSSCVLAGQCAALNVPAWDHRAIRRGDVVTVPGYFAPETWYAAELRLLPEEKLAGPVVSAGLKNGASAKLHTGTSEVLARVYSLEGGPVLPGSHGFVQVRLERPVVAGPGDPFILRSLNPVRTIGGGRILEATSRRLKRHRPEVRQMLVEQAAALDDDLRWVEQRLRRAPGLAASEADLAGAAKIPRLRVAEILAQLVSEQKAVALGAGLYLHAEGLFAARERILAAVRQFHEQSPESLGPTAEQLRQATGLEKPVLAAVLGRMKAQGDLVERGQRLGLPGHRPRLEGPQGQLVGEIEHRLLQHLFHPPGADELAAATGASSDAVRKALAILVEHGRAVAVADGLWFHADALARAQQILVEYLLKEGRLESVRFKYLLDTTRKYALPLLDYFDRVGLLRRSGNTRFLREKPQA